MNLSAADINVYDACGEPSTKTQCDSVPISYDDLKIVNSKLIELEYEKDINKKLKEVVDNDKVIINNYAELNKKLNKDCRKAVMQRNICIGVAVVTTICAIIFICK